MDQFDDYSQVNVIGADLASGAAGQKGHEWSQTFAASPNGVGDITFDRRIEYGGLLRNASIYFVQVRLHQLHHPGKRSDTRGSRCSCTCKSFHRRRIEGRLVGCQNNTSRKSLILGRQAVSPVVFGSLSKATNVYVTMLRF